MTRARLLTEASSLELAEWEALRRVEARERAQRDGNGRATWRPG